MKHSAANVGSEASDGAETTTAEDAAEEEEPKGVSDFKLTRQAEKARGGSLRSVFS